MKIEELKCGDLIKFKYAGEVLSGRIARINGGNTQAGFFVERLDYPVFPYQELYVHPSEIIYKLEEVKTHKEIPIHPAFSLKLNAKVYEHIVDNGAIRKYSRSETIRMNLSGPLSGKVEFNLNGFGRLDFDKEYTIEIKEK